MSLRPFDVVLFPLQLDLMFLMARLICSSTKWFGKSFLIRGLLMFLCSEKKIGLEVGISLVQYIRA